MKTLFILSAAVLMLSACSNDRELGNPTPETKANAIGFEVLKKHVLVRSGSTTGLEETDHYNFGVFAYKNSDAANPIMSDYLVGYFGNGDPKVGYSAGSQTTLEGSRWAYEGLGSSEYNYAGTDGYYTTRADYYMSNWPNQYLRYWDKSSNYTEFFAYAPYLHSSTAGNHIVAISNIESGSCTLTFADRSIVAGNDDRSKFEYMYAYTKVENAQYNTEVQLQFKRLTAKVNIAFYEEIAGYSVEILNLKDDTEGVCAAPAKRSGSEGSYTYKYGTVYKNSGLKIEFSEPARITWQNPVAMVSEHLTFEAPSGTISETNTQDKPATKSNTTYYAIPKAFADCSATSTDIDTGLTFHITYKLTSTTGETITVHNATVHVPANCCQWVANYGYTYVFKITKNSTGSTGSPSDIDPNDPAVGTQALYPIVFDNCTIEDWETAETQTINVN